MFIAWWYMSQNHLVYKSQGSDFLDLSPSFATDNETLCKLLNLSEPQFPLFLTCE